MQFGLYHPLEQGAWRKVSEDSGERRSFLLIDCTERLSLPLQNHRATSTFRYSVFPAYSQVYLRNYNFRSCPNSTNPELYIVDSTLRLPSLPIVTAAVYRGFDQELRLAADPIN
jgi:hypothetical protein